jgi:hypothetical protein
MEVGRASLGRNERLSGQEGEQVADSNQATHVGWCFLAGSSIGKIQVEAVIISIIRSRRRVWWGDESVRIFGRQAVAAAETPSSVPTHRHLSLSLNKFIENPGRTDCEFLNLERRPEATALGVKVDKHSSAFVP